MYVCSSTKAAAAHTYNDVEGKKKTSEFSHSLTLTLIIKVGSEFYMHAIWYQNKYMFESICSIDTDNISIKYAKFDHTFNSKL